MHVELRVAIGAQGLADHDRAEVRAADADVDHVGDGPAGVARPLPVAHLLGEGAHPIEHGVHLGHDVLAVHLDGPPAAVAQGRVQHGAPLGGVDLLAGEHALAPALELALAGQLTEQRHRLVGDPVLGVIQQDLPPAQGEALEALGVGGEEIAHVHVGHLFVVAGERLPGGAFGQAGHGPSCRVRPRAGQRPPLHPLARRRSMRLIRRPGCCASAGRRG